MAHGSVGSYGKIPQRHHWGWILQRHRAYTKVLHARYLPSRVISTVIRVRGGRPRNCCSISGWGSSCFSPPKLPDRLWRQSTQLFSVYRGTLYPVTRRPERIADHKPPSSAEVKNGLRYTSTTQYTVTKWTGTLVNLAQDLRFGLVRLF
jgi:hypothetical protein